MPWSCKMLHRVRICQSLFSGLLPCLVIAQVLWLHTLAQCHILNIHWHAAYHCIPCFLSLFTHPRSMVLFMFVNPQLQICFVWVVWCMSVKWWQPNQNISAAVIGNIDIGFLLITTIITIEFYIAHWSIDKSMFSGALWCAQEIKYQMQVQS